MKINSRGRISAGTPALFLAAGATNLPTDERSAVLTAWLRAPLLAAVAIALVCACGRTDSVDELSNRALKSLARNDYAAAEASLNQAMEELRTRMKMKGVSESEHQRSVKQLAAIYASMGRLNMSRGHLKEAISHLQQSLSLYETVTQSSDRSVAQALHALVACYFAERRYEEAEKACLRELEISERALKSDRLLTAVALNNLAKIQEKLGRPVEARKNFEKALRYCQGYGEKGFDALIDILNNFAIFCKDEGNYAEAKELVNRALTLEEQEGSGFSTDKIKSLYVLAGINIATYDFEQAEANYRLALKLIEEHPGGSPALACEGLDYLAELLLAEREFADSEKAFQQCLEACIRAHGPDHPCIAERLGDMAVLYRRTGRLAEAERALKRALEILRTAVGVETPMFLETLNRLTAVLEDDGKYAEAEALYADVLPDLKAKVGEDHPYVADTLDNWAMFLEKTKDQTAAGTKRMEAKKIRSKLARSTS